MVWVFKRFEKYLLGRRFKAYVDQGSLSWLKDRQLSSINNKRLQGSFAYLRQFQFDLYYLKSAKMREVDALSRAPVGAAAAAVSQSGTVYVDVQYDHQWTVPMAPSKAKKAEVKALAELRQRYYAGDRAVDEYEIRSRELALYASGMRGDPTGPGIGTEGVPPEWAVPFPFWGGSFLRRFPASCREVCKATDS